MVALSFSVVHHPENHFLDKSMTEYAKLTDNSPKFNSFTSDKLIDAASIDGSLKEKKTSEVTIFTAKCNAAIDVAKELEALRIKAERKHREAEKQYEAFCKRNGIKGK